MINFFILDTSSHSNKNITLKSSQKYETYSSDDYDMGQTLKDSNQTATTTYEKCIGYLPLSVPAFFESLPASPLENKITFPIYIETVHI